MYVSGAAMLLRITSNRSSFDLIPSISGFWCFVRHIWKSTY